MTINQLGLNEWENFVEKNVVLRWEDWSLSIKTLSRFYAHLLLRLFHSLINIDSEIDFPCFYYDLDQPQLLMAIILANYDSHLTHSGNSDI